MRLSIMSTLVLLISLSAVSAFAQTGPLDCEAAVNAGNPECLNLPPVQDATNFVPLIAPALGGFAALAGIAAAAGGGGEGGNTTTSTTSTVPN